VEAVGGGKLAPAQHEHVGLVGSGQRSVETGDSCSDDDKSVPRHGGFILSVDNSPGIVYRPRLYGAPRSENFEEPTT
jgi:hypothetical protein